MTFKEASETIIPLGKFGGITIDVAARTDDGLRYLDWLVGQKFLHDYAEFRPALVKYLADDSIQRDLRELDGEDPFWEDHG